ncbi:DPP IV N-terminal domain-containing protein [Streptomyces sp. NBC_00401]|uniref:DPP IV N-terminal domain-containing protein n=1 Tax=unclassified Streptomyces TaxID=2593676 RepID=UPI00225B24EC|nr:DPP IV N-terminal domain-containing protein [Streptomyces sp. NBC_00401]MCX5080948.1 DPP IV N-terminal domain-containing protein [Streptomyces sp. NBC_00401]
MLFKHVVLAVGVVVAAGLPTAGTAAAEQGTAAGRITATDYSSGSPALVSLDPASGDVIRTFAQNAEDGVLSPKGSTVAYIQRDDTCIPQTEGCKYARNLVVADGDGGDQRVLVRGITPETNEAPYVGHPDWSPDSRRIVYDSPRGMEWIKSDGTGQEVLTTTGGAGTFSPDGQSIAFVRTTTYETADGWENGTDVWVMDIATRQVHQISTTHNARSTPVDWSPDGQRIAYATENGLNAVDVATGAVTELQSSWTTPLSGIQGPVFSPDGTRITFSAMDEGDYSHNTYVVDAADGKNLQVLTDQAVTPTDWLSR